MCQVRGLGTGVKEGFISGGVGKSFEGRVGVRSVKRSWVLRDRVQPKSYGHGIQLIDILLVPIFE